MAKQRPALAPRELEQWLTHRGHDNWYWQWVADQIHAYNSVVRAQREAAR